MATPITQLIVDLLVAERILQGVTQAEVARRMGSATSWVQKIEYNKQAGRQISAFQRYADALNLDLRVTIVREGKESTGGEGLAHARSQGRVGGRPTVMTSERLQAALLLHNQGKNKTQIGKALGVSRMAVARALERAGTYSRLYPEVSEIQSSTPVSTTSPT